MPIARFEFHDGRIGRFEVPEGTTPEEAQSMISEHVYSKPQEKIDPTEGMSFGQKFNAGIGKALVDTGRGLGQLGRYAVGDKLADYIGLPTQSDIDESKRLDAPLMQTGAGLAGNIGGNIAATLAPGALLKFGGTLANMPKVAGIGQALMTPDTIRKGAMVGGALGFMQPTASDESKTTQVGLGALGGGVGAAIPKTLGRMLSPETRPEVSALMKEGITPTPGQILGGAAERIEEGATSIPFVGDTIKNAQRRAIEDFNVSAYNRALSPIGSKFDRSVGIGRDGIEDIYNQLSKAYDDLLPKLTIKQDQQYVSDLANLRSLAQEMPDQQAGQFERILESAVSKRFAPNGGMMGETMKEVDSKLGQEIRSYSKSLDPDHRKLSDALKETQAILRGLVERNNPQHADTLKGINQGYANLIRIEKAGGSLGAHEGLFTPAQLKSAAKSSDSSVRKRQFSHGNALLQDLAETGQNVLSKKVPDSGTAFRLQNMLPMGGAYMLSPDLALSALGAAGAYTKTGQKTLAALLTQRPDLLMNSGKSLKELAPVGSRLLAPAFINFGEQ